MSLLLTCHQIHEESCRFLYDNNVLLFDNSWMFQRFMTLQTLQQKGLFKNLGFLVAKLNSTLYKVPLRVIRSLKNLKTLQINIEYTEEEFDVLTRAGEASKDILLALILRWSVLDLKDVTILFTGRQVKHPLKSQPDQLRRLENESFLASHVRSRLLDPNGAAQHSERSRIMHLALLYLGKQSVTESRPHLWRYRIRREMDIWSVDSRKLEAALRQVASAKGYPKLSVW